MQTISSPASNGSLFSVRLIILVVAMLGLTGLMPERLAAQESQAYAILIVGDEGDAEMYKQEKALIQEMAKYLRKQQQMPIYSYHFNKDRERAYCEKKLNILKEDLLFVGIVSLKDRVPRKVVYRLDRIVNPSRSANDVLARANELLEPEATGTPDADPSPSPASSPAASPEGSPSASPSATTSSGTWRVQLGVFTQSKGAQDLAERLKAKGYEAKIDSQAGEGGTSYKVWVGNFPSKEDAIQAQSELKNDGFGQGFVVDSAGK